MNKSEFALVVRWSEPEDGIHVYGPYPDSRTAEADWNSVCADYFNEDTLPDDVIHDIVPMEPRPC